MIFEYSDISQNWIPFSKLYYLVNSMICPSDIWLAWIFKYLVNLPISLDTVHWYIVFSGAFSYNVSCNEVWINKSNPMLFKIYTQNIMNDACKQPVFKDFICSVFLSTVINV